MTAKSMYMLGAYGFWTENYLYRDIPALTRGISCCRFPWKSEPISRLLRQENGYRVPVLTRIPTGLHTINMLRKFYTCMLDNVPTALYQPRSPSLHSIKIRVFFFGLLTGTLTWFFIAVLRVILHILLCSIQWKYSLWIHLRNGTTFNFTRLSYLIGLYLKGELVKTTMFSPQHI